MSAEKPDDVCYPLSYMFTRRIVSLVMFKRTFSNMTKEMKQGTEICMEKYEKWSKEDLIKRIQELELAKELPNTNTVDVAKVNNIEASSHPVRDENSPKLEESKPKKKRTFDFSKHNTRFIALRFAYLGWNFSGLAFQFEPTPLPTIEQEILNALAMAKLIPSPELDSCDFSRCGRTDKGVSAMNQVISLNIRSSLSDEEQKLRENDDKEIPYLTILNSLLPADIRMTAVAMRPPPKFDARFSCDYRHYRYLFKKADLDIDLMNEGAAKYVGPHDFRNFCKIDGSKQITNYGRTIHSAKIIPYKDDFYCLDLKGTAFLWHQVRCMMAVLFLIGQKLEKPQIIDELMDIDKYPNRPIYEMANDVPLVLYDCVFPEMEWLTPMDFNNRNKLFRSFAGFKGLAMDHQVKSQITQIMQNIVMKDEAQLLHSPGCGAVNVGNGSGRNFTNYVPLEKRDVLQTFEVINAKHREKKLRKLEMSRQDTELPNKTN